MNIAMVLSRRMLLGSGAALVAAAVAGVGVAILDLPGAADGWLVLGAEEAALVEAMFDTIFPPGNAIGVAARTLPVARAFDLELAEVADPELVPKVRYLLHALDLGVRVQHGAPFSALDEAARADVLRAWEDPRMLPRRLAYEALKVFFGMVYFNAVEVRSAIGVRSICESVTA